ncbi:peptidase M16 [Limnothrix sp. PR1529]|uniref:M16 family metallopeptidase n=1 Tax=Limnothrix sp. PR1529 TaxID=1704291 RepID=UPI00081E4C59|nr:pitrilysin family protein [Limnothrix sp. PR1529]OCQ95240.1 peptidase M16 [Limnothrix sp. P13C2]PIB07507.1 peptidase M16 [Limnothrix sp. PR1529]
MVQSPWRTEQVPRPNRQQPELWQLANGLRVVYHYVPVSPVVTMDVWVKAGAVAEPIAWDGMAHFLEHMIFKGTDRLGPGEFDRAIESRGGATNAATSHDYAHYFVTTAVEHAEATLPHLAELLLNATIPDQEFELERSVVLEEIRQAYDSPDWVGFQMLLSRVYPDHAYGRSVLGSEESLMKRSPAEMRRFHACHYQPENLVVALVGGLPPDRARHLMESAFAAFGQPQACPPQPIGQTPPIATVHRQELHRPYLEQARVMMAWTGPSLQDIGDTYALEVLATVLGIGRTSRLVSDLREDRQWVLAIDCEASAQRDASLLTIGAWLDVRDVSVVEACICDHLALLRDHPINPIELKRAQRLLCSDYIFATETPNQLASLYGYYGLLDQLPEATVYPDRIQAVGPEDVQRVAQKYLSPDRYAMVTLVPS